MNLETWLATATENLAPKAVVKVREDISMHVETAVNRYQLERHSELEALELAVKDLGDANISTRGFEKAYLTISELEGFSNDHKEAANSIRSVTFGLILAVLLTVWDLKTPDAEHLAFFFLTMASFSFFSSVLARKYSLKLYIKPKILLNVFYFLISGIILIWYCSVIGGVNQIGLKNNVVNSQRIIGDTRMTAAQIGFVLSMIWMVMHGLFLAQSDYVKWRKMRYL